MESKWQEFLATWLSPAWWNNNQGILSFVSIIVSIIGIIITYFLTWRVYKLSTAISAENKYKKELELTKLWNSLDWYKSIILADINKIGKEDPHGKNYPRQLAERYGTIPGVGFQAISSFPTDDNIPVGLIPFDWIKYIRLEDDGIDGKPIIACEFKGIKYLKNVKGYSNFKSPFKSITNYFENKNYVEGRDPVFLKYRNFK